MNLSQLYYFKKLAELQHYTRAAKELFITQPTLSDAISSLERELGVPLFHREGRNIGLTFYGEEFYEYVSSALSRLDEGIAAVKKHKEVVSGIISLGTAFTTLEDYLHPLLNAFGAEYGPNVQIKIFQGFTNSLTRGLHDKLFDVVFCGKREEETEIEYYPVLFKRLVLCVREDHPLATRDRVSFSDLHDQEVHTYHRGTPIGEQVYAMLCEHRLDKVQQLYDDDITMASLLSFKGNVAALMLDSIGLKLFTNLKTILVDEIPQEFYWVYLAYHKRHIRSAALDAFILFVKNYELNEVQGEA
ncbi:MAG: LysR family transcriptional regulator [Eggerthellaceae bacterium]|jgi:DNA-binding transcriptional LysR family regulator|nr:LysR family transcriptional regulator [Eggerthellaceae bacterium]MDR2716212.1 LysR family transcriptional regulator [Coriobacteriaceae bacterium]